MPQAPLAGNKMAADGQVTLGTTTNGKGACGLPGRPVELPVRMIATGRGIIAGDPGSGIGNTVRLLATTLAARDHRLLILDDTGNFAELLDGHEAVRVGGSGACDLRLTDDRIDPVADLAFEAGPPVVVDRSTYTTDAEANAAVAAIARRLSSVAGDQSGPFLLLVVGIESYLPAGGPEDDVGRVLRTITRDGGRRDIGVCAVSQQPAAVGRAFRDGCDWRIWHRLSHTDQTAVIRRELDGEYASAVADLCDDEAFLVTDPADRVRRVSIDQVEHDDRSADSATDGATEAVRDSQIATLLGRIAEHEDRIATLEARVADGPAVGSATIEPDESGEPPNEAGGADQESDSETATSRLDKDGFAAFGALMDEQGGPTTSAAEGDATTDASLGEHAGLGGETGKEAPVETTSPHNPTPTRADGSGLSTTKSVSAQVTDFERGAAAGVLGPSRSVDPSDSRPAIVCHIETALDSFDQQALSVLAAYRADGPSRPTEIYQRVTGSTDRVTAYAVNRQLRRVGLIEHLGRGHYDYALPTAIEAACEDCRKPGLYARSLEQTYLDDVSDTDIDA